MKKGLMMTAKEFRALVLALGMGLLITGCSSTGEDGGEVAGSERECRSFAQPGTKMRESVCRSAEQWAIIDAGEAERAGREGLVDEFFRRQGELGAQGQGPAFDSATGP